MDIKSASKAHNVEQKLDDRPLSTEYHEPASISSASPTMPHLYPAPTRPYIHGWVSSLYIIFSYLSHTQYILFEMVLSFIFIVLNFSSHPRRTTLQITIERERNDREACERWVVMEIKWVSMIVCVQWRGSTYFTYLYVLYKKNWHYARCDDGKPPSGTHLIKNRFDYNYIYTIADTWRVCVCVQCGGHHRHRVCVCVG